MSSGEISLPGTCRTGGSSTSRLVACCGASATTAGLVANRDYPIPCGGRRVAMMAEEDHDGQMADGVPVQLEPIQTVEQLL